MNLLGGERVALNVREKDQPSVFSREPVILEVAVKKDIGSANASRTVCCSNALLSAIIMELVYRCLVTSDVELTWTWILWDRASNLQLLCIQESDTTTGRSGWDYWRFGGLVK